MNYHALYSLIESHDDWTGPGSVSIAELDAYADNTQNTLPDSIPSLAVWNSIISNRADYIALTDVERDLIRTTVKGGGVSSIDIRSDIDGQGTDSPERQLLLGIFGAGSNTISDLVTKFTESKALWEIHNVGQNPDPEDFQEAIALYGN